MNAMTGVERQQLIEEIIGLQRGGDISLGTAVRRLRLEITGFDQETFAQMCGMSTRALYQLETDKGNPTLNTVDSILRKFGLRMGIMPAAAPHKMPSLETTSHLKERFVDNNNDQNREVSVARSRGAKPKGLAGHRPAVGK